MERFCTAFHTGAAASQAPQLDRWVISTAFLQYEKSNLPHRMSCICTINLSGASVFDDNFYDFRVEQFSLYKIPPRGICFEITETSAIANLPQARVLIRKLKDLGCRFALDDFGSGMSSFTYLKHLPVDYSKIDSGFVKDMVQDPIDRAMVEAINHIGHACHADKDDCRMRREWRDPGGVARYRREFPSGIWH
jgi:EAL domain-containing protein (putative c-di-GMP-specific phosphodiesterase class I)